MSVRRPVRLARTDSDASSSRAAVGGGVDLALAAAASV